MKKIALVLLAGCAAAACSPQIHLDFLGKDTLQEVVLVPSPAGEKILVLDVDGMISAFAPQGAFAREGDILSRMYYRLEQAAKDPSIKGIILRLDTPGGEVTASDILYHEILRFKTKTKLPCVALVMSVAASGGYYIASACDAIIAHPTSITGSIGVISVFPSVASLFDKVGVKMTVITSGAMKDSGSPFRTMTEEEKKSFQAIVDEYYEDFLSVVAAGRKGRLTPDDIRPLADGRIYTAKQALKLKLIDEVGYFEGALKKILDLAGINTAKVVSYTYFPKTKTNIYAAGMSGAPLLEKKSWEEWLPQLRTGFYYLWLPEAQK
jgi:protease-4